MSSGSVSVSDNAILQDRRLVLSNISKHGLDYLKYLELNNIHQSRDIVQIGNYLFDETSQLSSSANKWRLFERILMSALELKDSQTASKFLKLLHVQFPSSSRVQILDGMYLEMNERFNEAKQRYLQILSEQDSNHMMAMKRLVAVEISQGNSLLAIKLLCDYLRLYGNDLEAWKQLSFLYQRQHCYHLSKFCLEELILIDKDSYLFYMQYAEMLYNIGTRENLIHSLKYFCQAICISNDQNTRSIFGVLMCIRSLNSGSDLTSTHREFVKQCSTKLIDNYSKKADNGLTLVLKQVLSTFN